MFLLILLVLWLMLKMFLLMHEVFVDMLVEIWEMFLLILFMLTLMHEVFVDMLVEI